MLLRPAGASVVAVVGAHSALASYTFVTREARAEASGSITKALVGAFCPRVQIICSNYRTDPSEILGACSQRAIWSSPLWFAGWTVVAKAVIVNFASTMT